MAAIFTQAGKIQIATYLLSNVTHLAIGSGNWSDPNNPPAPTFTETALATEIGRIPINTADYLILDPLGTINFNNTTWSTTGTPTNTIQLSATIIANTLSNGTVIKEIGFFGAGVVVSGGGYQPVVNVTTPGKLFIVENLVAVTVLTGQAFTRNMRITL